MVYIPKQKQTLPICRRLKYYANAAMAEQPLTTAWRDWKQNHCAEKAERTRTERDLERVNAVTLHKSYVDRLLPPTRLAGSAGVVMYSLCCQILAFLG